MQKKKKMSPCPLEAPVAKEPRLFLLSILLFSGDRLLTSGLVSIRLFAHQASLFPHLATLQIPLKQLFFSVIRLW